MGKRIRIDNAINAFVELLEILTKKKPKDKIPDACPSCGKTVKKDETITLRFCINHAKKIMSITDEKLRAKKLKSAVKKLKESGIGVCLYPNCKINVGIEPHLSKGWTCKDCGYVYLYEPP